MRAMLLKDFYSLKESKILIVIMLLVAIVMAFWGSESGAAFITSYITVIAAVLVLNTIAYDEADNGYAFLFTLPASRRAYIQAKYLFGFITGMGGWIIAVVLATLMGEDSGQMEAGARLSMFGGALMIFLLLQAVMIPIQIKFGGQKGKLVIVIVLAAGIAAGMALINHTDFAELFAFISNMKMAGVAALGIVFVAAAMFLSYKCSVRIIEKKEF